MKHITMTRFLILTLLGLSVGCTVTDKAQIEAMASPATISVYSGGQLIATFRTETGVHCTNAGSCYFIESVTHQFVEVTGTIIARSERAPSR